MRFVHSIPSLGNPHSIEIATRAADQFTRLYYSTYDSQTRVIDLPKFYRPSSAISWNGNPFSGVDGIRELLNDTPTTKHEVQCFDCHPIPGLSCHWPLFAVVCPSPLSQAANLQTFWSPFPGQRFTAIPSTLQLIAPSRRMSTVNRESSHKRSFSFPTSLPSQQRPAK